MAADLNHPSGPRYSLLETVRAYATERLAERSADLAEMQRRHATYFRALAEHVEPKLVSPDRRPGSATQPELANIRAALHWACAHGDWAEGLLWQARSWVFWLSANHLREGYDALKSFLAVAPAESPFRLKALWAAGYLAFHLGDQDTGGSPSPWEAGLTLAQALGDGREIARFLAGVGSEAVVRGDFNRAAGLLDDTLTRAHHEQDPWLVQAATMWLGMLHWASRDLVLARQRLEEALEASRLVADAHTTGNVLIMLADVLLLQGDPAEALERARASLSVRATGLDAWVVGVTLTVLGRIAVVAGDAERAARLFGAAEGLRSSIGAAFTLPMRWRDDHRCAVETVRQSLDPSELPVPGRQGER